MGHKICSILVGTALSPKVSGHPVLFFSRFWPFGDFAHICGAAFTFLDRPLGKTLWMHAPCVRVCVLNFSTQFLLHPLKPSKAHRTVKDLRTGLCNPKNFGSWDHFFWAFKFCLIRETVQSGIQESGPREWGSFLSVWAFLMVWSWILIVVKLIYE